MNPPAAQKPSSAEPTPEERVERFKRIRAVSVVSAIAVVLLAVLTWGNKFMEQWDKLWARFHPKTYDVLIYHSLQAGLDAKTGLPWVWRVDDTGEKEQPYCPIGYQVTMSITNLMPDPMTIINYEASARGADGPWLPLQRIAMSQYQHIYFTTNGLSEATQFLTHPPPLDQQLSATSTLRPHQPLVGTAFFEDPSPYDNHQEFRITIRDALGHVFTFGIIRPSEVKANFGVGEEAQVGVHADLTDLKKHPYRQHCD